MNHSIPWPVFELYRFHSQFQDMKRLERDHAKLKKRTEQLQKEKDGSAYEAFAWRYLGVDRVPSFTF